MPSKSKNTPRKQKKAPAVEAPFEDFDSEEEEAVVHTNDEQPGQQDGPDVQMLDVEKDEEEEELERLIFGDKSGFRQAVGGFSWDATAAGSGQELVKVGEDEDEGPGIGGIDDADLFFIDSGPGQEHTLGEAEGDLEDEEEEKTRAPPAWEDSDDERITVSLASAPRLRKLRVTEEEDVIDGREYIRRLRRQYERLHPVPEWAANARENRLAKNKRRRDGEHDGSSDDLSAGSDADSDGESLSAQPLAKLLKDADILSRQTELGPRKRRKLRPEVIDIQRTKDIGGTQPSSITSLSFHPTLPILLSSGPSSTLYLHQVYPHPPNPHPLLTSLHMKKTPLTTTAFHPLSTDSRIFLSARRRYFYVWNLVSGNIEKVTRVYGHAHEQRSMERFSLSPNGKYMALIGSARKGGGVVNILSASTLQWICQARIESIGGIADIAWWRDGEGLAIAGKNGEITEWSVAERCAVARWTDEGALGTTVIALGGDSGRSGHLGGDRWIAVGSSSGIVNVYDRRAWAAASATTSSTTTTSIKINPTSNPLVPPTPTPLRALDNLTTPISHLTFSPDGQVLAMASTWKNNALRLVHLPSVTVYKNWPTANTPLGRITAVAFGEVKVDDGNTIGGDNGEGAQGTEGNRSGIVSGPKSSRKSSGSKAGETELYLGVGNEAGRIRLWEIRE